MAVDLHQKFDLTYETPKDSKKPLQIRGLDVLIGRVHGKIVDIRVPLNDTENYDLNTHFDNKQRRSQTSCYTYIFQSELAAFEQKCLVHRAYKKDYPGIGDLATQLRTWSEEYAVLEAMVNNPPFGLTRDSLGELYNQIVRLQGRLIPPVPTEMRDKLTPQLENFKKDIQSLFHKSRGGRPLSKGDIRRFFSIQQEDRKRPCLGKFIADQMTALTEYGTERVYILTDENLSNKPWNRFKQLFAMHPLIKNLSDAGAHIEQKGLSLYGARFNNSRDPVPGEMIEALKSRPREGGEEKWTSIISHLERPDDLEELDTLLIEVARNKARSKDQVPSIAHTPRQHSLLTWTGWEYWGRQSWVFMTNVFELPLALGLRLAPALVLAIPVIALRSFFEIGISVYSLFRPKEEKTANKWSQRFDIWIPRIVYSWAMGIGVVIGIFQAALDHFEGHERRSKSYKNALFSFIDNPLTTLDETLEKAHQSGSGASLPLGPLGKIPLGVIASKKRRNNKLEDVDLELQNEKGLNQPVSQYDVLLNELNSTKITSFFTKGIGTIVTTIFSPIKLLTDTIKAQWDQGWKTPEKYHEDVFERYNKIAMHEAFAEYEKQLGAPPTMPPQGPPGSPVHKFRNSVKPWVINEISSPLDFLDEIFVGLSDSIIGPMFRKSPGLATLFFIFANVSLGSLMLPGVFSGAETSWLKWLPRHLSEGFMGKLAGKEAASVNKLFAVFLQWKITFFAAEAGLELAHGDMDFLKVLLHNPEKITLATGVMVAMGLAMNWVPEIDPQTTIPLHKLSGGALQNIHFTNYYLEAVNIFSHEAKEVTQFGTPPLTGIEYAFLSLKSIFLVEDMMSGGHKGHDRDIAAILGLKFYDNDKVKNDPVKEIIQIMHQKHAELYPGKNPGKTLAQILAERGPEGLKNELIRPAIIDYCNDPEHPIKLDDHKLNGCIEFLFNNVKEAVSLAEKTQLETDKNTVDMNQSIDKHVKRMAVEPPHRTKLMDAIQAVQRMEATAQGFDSAADATAFYDYLYKTFKDYNNEQRALGRWDQQVDKEQFLHAFYNKHIYKGSNNFMRFVSIFPLYPVTLIWRGLQYFFSDSPATHYKIKRSFRKDGVMALQTIAMGGRVGHEVVRAYTYGFAGVAATVAFVLTIPLFLQSVWRFAASNITGNPPPTTPTVQQNILNWVIDGLATWTIYNKIQAPAQAKATYARFARVAGTGSENLSATGKDIKKQLLEHSAHPETKPVPTPMLHQYDRKHTKNWLHKYVNYNKNERQAEKALLTAYAEFETRVNDLNTRYNNPELDKSGIVRSESYGFLRNANNTLNELKNTAGGFKLPSHTALIKDALSRMEDHKRELDTFEQALRGQEARQKITHS